jgi:hypothetical protein
MRLISSQRVKGALANPVKSLRSEQLESKAGNQKSRARNQEPGRKGINCFFCVCS